MRWIDIIILLTAWDEGFEGRRRNNGRTRLRWIDNINDDIASLGLSWTKLKEWPVVGPRMHVEPGNRCLSTAQRWSGCISNEVTTMLTSEPSSDAYWEVRAEPVQAQAWCCLIDKRQSYERWKGCWDWPSAEPPSSAPPKQKYTQQLY